MPLRLCFTALIRLLLPMLMLAAVPLPAQAAEPANARSDARIDVPTSARQGEMVIGRGPPGSQVALAGRQLRVDPEGWFVFGFGRDAGEPAALAVQFPDGRQAKANVAVQARDWRIERVDGGSHAVRIRGRVLAQELHELVESGLRLVDRLGEIGRRSRSGPGGLLDQRYIDQMKQRGVCNTAGAPTSLSREKP